MMRWLVLMFAASLAWPQSPEVQRLIDESLGEVTQQHFDVSLQLARQAIETSQAERDQKGLAAAWLRLSFDCFYARRLPEAVDAAKHAQKAAADIGDKSRAIANGENALRLAREIHDAEQEAACLFVLGVMEREQHMNAAAIEHLSAAPKMRETNEQTRIQILQSLGTAYCDLKQYGRCTETMKEQLSLALASGVPNQIAWAHHKLAYAESLTGEHAGAYADSLDAVRELRSAEHDPYDETVFLSAVGEELVSLGRVREAIPYFEQGIDLIEQLRQGLVPSEEALAKAASAADTKDLFDETVDAQFRIDPAQAFHTHELARARAFLSILSDSKIDLRQGLSEADRAREAALFSRIAAIRKQLSQPGRASVAAQQADAELGEAESALESFRLEMRKANPRLANIRYPRPLAVDEARELLKPGTTLVEYSLGDKRSFVRVVSREKFASAELPAAKEIESQVKAYRGLLTSRVSGLTVKQSERDVESQAARLYGTLLKPVEAEFAGSRELVIVPDGALHYLPFEALSRSGEYLLERFPISYAASATSLLGVDVQASPVHAGRELLAFGDPLYAPGRGVANGGFDPGPLPYTRAEIEGIAALFPREARSVYLGAGASEKSVAGEAVGQYRYLHFATHGLLDEAHPERSGLALTPGRDDDGVLRVDAIATLRLQADVVTLSACNTGLGRLFSGEGMLGLVRAFLYAGAGSVNVSLWNVNDAATAALMKEFYRNLSRSMPPDQALRGAKLTLLRQQGALWRHPHFWAPFVLWLR